jgi:uncharacterized membrane protein (DUF485 family)
MKEYLQLFRGSAFTGAFSLYKRILLSNLMMNVLIFVVSGAILLPLILNGLGWELADLLSFRQKLQEMFSHITPGSNPLESFMQLFGAINYAYIFLAGLIALLVSGYKNVAFYRLNDNEVRHGNRSFLTALKEGFSEKMFSMIGLSFVLGLIMLVVFLVYALVVYLLYSAAAFIGIIFGFILFFVVSIFLIRFMFASPALVHGNMGIFESINYSFRSITWKRAALLFLMGIVAFIVSALLGMIIGLLTNLMGLNAEGASFTMLCIGQVIETITNAIISAFFIAAFTAIYFRYSDDSDEESQGIEEHFIN